MHPLAASDAEMSSKPVSPELPNVASRSRQSASQSRPRKLRYVSGVTTQRLDSSLLYPARPIAS
jgi:hypothetical protein